MEQKRESFIESFQLELNEFINSAGEAGLSVSVKPNKNFRYIGELLEKYNLTSLFPNNEFTESGVDTFRDLLEKCVSIESTCSFLQKKIDFLKTDDPKRLEEISILIHGLISLRVCFQLLKTSINKKHLKRQRQEPLFLCALCWKRVRVSDESESFDRKDSTFYCPDHLPNKSEHFYRRDKTALFSAMKASNNRFLNELQRYEKLSFKTSFSLIPTFYKWLGSFSPKPSVLYSWVEIIKDQSQNWQGKANRLTELSRNFYPKAYDKIKDIDAHQYNSVESWSIDGVINALDNSKAKSEVAFWNQQEPTRIKLSSFLVGQENQNNKVSENEETNEYLMLMFSVLSRYEAYQIVRNTPQPRGGGHKNKQLRATVKALREQNILTTGKQNVALIANDMNISQARVYILLKELNTSDKSECIAK